MILSMCAMRQKYIVADRSRGHDDRWLRTEQEECAWQESNLLPFGPEPNALSGELQARGRFPSLPVALNCAVREQVDRRAGNYAHAGRLHITPRQRAAPLAPAEPDSAQSCGIDAAGAGGSSRAALAVSGVRADRGLHRRDEIGKP